METLTTQLENLSKTLSHQHLTCRTFTQEFEEARRYSTGGTGNPAVAAVPASTPGTPATPKSELVRGFAESPGPDIFTTDNTALNIHWW